MSDELLQFHTEVDTTLMEVSSLQATGAVRAVQMTVIREDGLARTYTHYAKEFGFQLLGAARLAEDDLVQMLQRKAQKS